MENEWRNEASASDDSEEFYKSYVHKVNVGEEEREMKNPFTRFESLVVGFMVGALLVGLLIILNDPYAEGFNKGYNTAIMEKGKAEVTAYNEAYQKGFSDGMRR